MSRENIDTTFDLRTISEDQLCRLARHYRDFLEVFYRSDQTLLNKIGAMQDLPEALLAVVKDWAQFRNNVSRQSVVEVTKICADKPDSLPPSSLN